MAAEERDYEMRYCARRTESSQSTLSFSVPTSRGKFTKGGKAETLLHNHILARDASLVRLPSLSYFLKRSSKALRASCGRYELEETDWVGAVGTDGAVSFSMVVRKE